MAKKDFGKATDAEAALVTEIQKAVQQHMGTDRDGDYFPHGSEKVFRKLAEKIADVIEQKGAINTSPTLVAIARELQKESDRWPGAFDHANTIGFAFVHGLKNAGPSEGSPANRFAKMKL
jgi:hypothetical protein